MAQTDDDLKRDPENHKLLEKAARAEAIARQEQVADDDGMALAHPVFKDTEQAFDAGVNAGYAQCLEDMKTMVDRQFDVHQQRMRGVRVNL
jgi:hypothetical protein